MMAVMISQWDDVCGVSLIVPDIEKVSSKLLVDSKG